MRKTETSSLPKRFVWAFMALSIVTACVKSRDFDPVSPSCASDIMANASYADIKKLYVDKTVQIQEDLTIEGYVTSSDEAGNFFSILHFQDDPERPTHGFAIEVDLRDSHLFYPVGSRIHIKLKGLYLGKSKEVFTLGGTFTSFGNVSVGRLPSTVVDSHVLVACEAPVDLVPVPISLSEDIPEHLVHSLVRLDSLEISASELDQAFAVPREETERTLTNCDDNALILLNSGFSDFQAETLPEGNGSISGVLLRERDSYRIAIRNLEDIRFTGERCAEKVDEFTSSKIFISELADPDNNSGARFVEFYNSASEPLDLKGWSLRRYTNANTEISSELDLSGHIIGAGKTLVVSPNASEFMAVYGFEPDIVTGKNSPADSNGDDNLELVDAFGTAIDMFGVIGSDGTGTAHEFEDGRAVRNPDVIEANAQFASKEWTIYNDSGDAGTIKLPQMAPQDFTPGVRD